MRIESVAEADPRLSGFEAAMIKIASMFPPDRFTAVKNPGGDSMRGDANMSYSTDPNDFRHIVLALPSGTLKIFANDGTMLLKTVVKYDPVRSTQNGHFYGEYTANVQGTGGMGPEPMLALWSESTSGSPVRPFIGVYGMKSCEERASQWLKGVYYGWPESDTHPIFHILGITNRYQWYDARVSIVKG